MKKSKASSTEELFNSIAQFIEESRQLIADNKLLELSGLDDHVKTLCDAVLQLSQDERIIYADRLQQLLSDLKDLADSMVERRDVIASEILQLSQHKKASTAYRTTEVSGISSDKDED